MNKMVLIICSLLLIDTLQAQSNLVLVNNELWHKMSPEAAKAFFQGSPTWLKPTPKSYLFFKEANLQGPFIGIDIKHYYFLNNWCEKR